MTRAALLTLSILTASDLWAGQSRLVSVDVALPNGFPPGPTATAVVCRESSGRWRTIAWRLHSAPPPRVTGPAGERCRALVKPAAAAAYLASSESMWSDRISPLRIDPVWRRTIQIPGAIDDARWLGAEDVDGVECVADSGETRCLFAPAETPGVIVAQDGGFVRFALLSRGATTGVWHSAPAARLVRAQPPGAAPVTARAITLERALKQGTGRLFEARAAPGITITPITDAAFWIEGAAPESAAFLELRSAGAARLRIAAPGVWTSPLVPLDVRLPIEDVIDGDVRGRDVLREGTTVILSRIVDEGARPVKEEERALERIDQTVTDAAGRFRFTGLGRERYEVLAVHPAYGRARVVVTAPAFPRLVLKPGARIRGRVIEHGIPVASALVQMLPALDAVAAARNPILLAAEPVRTGADGRFEVTAPGEGRVVLAVGTERTSLRVDLGEAGALAEIVDVGDLKLEEPYEVEVLADLPDGCRLQAAGPIGVAGMSIVSLVSTSPGRWRFTPPAGGRWLFAALCGSQELSVDPSVVDIRSGPRDAIVLKVRR